MFRSSPRGPVGCDAKVVSPAGPGGRCAGLSRWVAGVMVGCFRVPVTAGLALEVAVECLEFRVDGILHALRSRGSWSGPSRSRRELERWGAGVSPRELKAGSFICAWARWARFERRQSRRPGARWATLSRRVVAGLRGLPLRATQPAGHGPALGAFGTIQFRFTRSRRTRSAAVTPIEVRMC